MLFLKVILGKNVGGIVMILCVVFFLSVFEGF